MTVTILIADDHALIRRALESLLEYEPDFRVVGQAADGEEALRSAQALKPDVLLADISMPCCGGVEIARELDQLQSSTAVIVLTPHEDEGSADEALEAGAKGYLTKIGAAEELVHAIRVAAHGGTFVAVNCQEAGRITSSAPSPHPGHDLAGF